MSTHTKSVSRDCAIIVSTCALTLSAEYILRHPKDLFYWFDFLEEKRQALCKYFKRENNTLDVKEPRISRLLRLTTMSANARVSDHSSGSRAELKRMMLGQALIQLLSSGQVKFTDAVGRLADTALTQFLAYYEALPQQADAQRKTSELGEMLWHTLNLIPLHSGDDHLVSEAAVWTWLKRLLSVKGINPNYDNSPGDNVMEYAVTKLCYNSHTSAKGVKVTQMLVEAKGDLNSPTLTGTVPILNNCITHEVYAKLVQMGGNINCDTSGDGITRLARCVMEDSESELFDLIHDYLEDGLDLCIRTRSDDRTPLELAREGTTIYRCLEEAMRQLRSSLFARLVKLIQAPEPVISLMVDFVCSRPVLVNKADD